MTRHCDSERGDCENGTWALVDKSVDDLFGLLVQANSSRSGFHRKSDRDWSDHVKC